MRKLKPTDFAVYQKNAKSRFLVSIVIAEKARGVTCHFAPFKRFDDHLIVQAGLTCARFGDFTVDILFQIGQARFFRFV